MCGTQGASVRPVAGSPDGGPGAVFSTAHVSAWRDDTGTLVVEHHQPGEGDNPWQVSTITEPFSRALRRRRTVQGRRILAAFADVLEKGPVLDYGCGQQAFLAQLLAAGHDGTGCDVGVPGFGTGEGVPDGRFLRLDEPWSVPTPAAWTTVVLLDVLEHHPEPAEFLRSLGAPAHLLIKVPLLTGPIGRLARATVRLGRPALMETLLLVGDISPHLRFFTPAGLDRVAAAAGYRRTRRHNLADVGAELPDRIRGGLGPHSGPARLVLAGMGVGLAAVAPLWTDTAVFLYER